MLTIPQFLSILFKIAKKFNPHSSEYTHSISSTSRCNRISSTSGPIIKEVKVGKDGKLL